MFLELRASTDATKVIQKKFGLSDFLIICLANSTHHHYAWETDRQRDRQQEEQLVLWDENKNQVSNILHILPSKWVEVARQV